MATTRASNRNLHQAKSAKNDEFYTQRRDIENELKHYRRHFEGKTVLCNCDDPFESNFFKYFAIGFNKLKLKKLITTCYAGSPVAGRQFLPLDDKGRPKIPYKAVMTTLRDANGDGQTDEEDVKELLRIGENELTRLEGDGDFRSPECLALLDEADIVVTNPPFSLFREYVTTLIDHGKSFVIIGHNNGRKYAEIFPLIKKNKLWLGMTHPKRLALLDHRLHGRF